MLHQGCRSIVQATEISEWRAAGTPRFWPRLSVKVPASPTSREELATTPLGCPPAGASPVEPVELVCLSRVFPLADFVGVILELRRAQAGLGNVLVFAGRHGAAGVLARQ